MKFYSVLTLFVVHLLILPTGALSGVAVQRGDTWTYRVLEGEYRYSQSGRVLKAGDTYDYTIVSTISEEGLYEFEIATKDHKVRGDNGNLGILGNEVIYTNWSYWEENALTNLESTYLPRGTVNITNEGSFFSIYYEILGFVMINLVYLKDSGVLKSVQTSAQDTVGFHAEIIGESTDNISQIIISSIILFVLSLPYLRKQVVKHRNQKERRNDDFPFEITFILVQRNAYLI